jgi:hypothetical protein
MAIWEAGASAYLEGVDLSSERVAEGERKRKKLGVPGRFWAEDVNAVELEANRYDLIFLRPQLPPLSGVGARDGAIRPGPYPARPGHPGRVHRPTQFQWTDLQIELTAGSSR